MKLRHRYRRLSVWKKWGFWGATASIISVLIMVLSWAVSVLRGGVDPITISPEKMEFTSATAFRDGPSVGAFAEQYEFTAHNGSTRPMYNIWVELKSNSFDYEDIEIVARPKERADCIPDLLQRADTHGLIMEDERGEESVLLAISRMAPDESYEYLVTIRDKSKYTRNGYVNAKLLNASHETAPTRARRDGQGTEVMFPTTLPKSGSVLGFIFFPCN